MQRSDKNILQEDIQGTDKHPTTVAKAYKLAQEYETSGLGNFQILYNNRNQDGNNANIYDNTARISFSQAEAGNDDFFPGIRWLSA